jgi:hypothetical protein
MKPALRYQYPFHLWHRTGLLIRTATTLPIRTPSNQCRHLQTLYSCDFGTEDIRPQNRAATEWDLDIPLKDRIGAESSMRWTLLESGRKGLDPWIETFVSRVWRFWRGDGSLQDFDVSHLERRDDR